MAKLNEQEIAKWRRLAGATNKAVSDKAKKVLKDAGVPIKEGDAAPATAPAKKVEPKKPEPKKPVAAKPAAKKAPVKKSVHSAADLKKCEDLLAEFERRRAKTSAWKKKRAKSGLPALKTPAEVISDAAETAHDRLKDNVKKGDLLNKTETKEIKKEIKDLVEVVVASIPKSADKKSFIAELIAELKKIN